MAKAQAGQQEPKACFLSIRFVAISWGPLPSQASKECSLAMSWSHVYASQGGGQRLLLSQRLFALPALRSCHKPGWAGRICVPRGSIKTGSWRVRPPQDHTTVTHPEVWDPLQSLVPCPYTGPTIFALCGDCQASWEASCPGTDIPVRATKRSAWSGTSQSFKCVSSTIR